MYVCVMCNNTEYRIQNTAVVYASYITEMREIYEE